MDFDIVIIGAGIVGLAAAENLSRKNSKILVIEKETRIGTGVSSRNSEVVHAGIYYPKDSLKSSLCIRGKELLYEWCNRHNVSFRKTEKYIIASVDDELEKLESIRKNAFEAGMQDLFFTTNKRIQEDNPVISCVGGLYSPTSGIVSVHELMDSLKQKSETRGTDFLFCSKPLHVKKNSSSSGYILSIIDSSNEISEIETAIIINCAGLYSDEVSKLIGIDEESYKIKFVKGNYFKYQGKKNLVKNLIYPVPMPKLQGLGTHITLDLNGGIKFGPDVEKMESNVEDYSVTLERHYEFYNSVKSYFPSIEPENLVPDMVGIRPRLAASKDFNDFIIKEEGYRDFPGIINCIGIESPGLTASLAIAEYISSML